MKKFWIYNLITTLFLLVIFEIILYTIGIYNNPYGHYFALTVCMISCLQTITNFIIGIHKLKSLSNTIILLGIVSIILSSLTALYIFNCLFISC